MKQKKIPLRKCLGCGEMKPKAELVRVVKAPSSKDYSDETAVQGKISLDLTGKAPGRGAYVCKSVKCLEKAIKAKRLERAFSASVPQEIYDGLKEEMEKVE